jgi:2-polyprenyl-6-hydroxyphenyl methylase/3-demethylubiquinone-9 3-methyltransferase
MNDAFDIPLKASKKTNLYPKELAHFSEFASVWWDPLGDFAALHHINPLRLAWIEKNCVLSHLQVLDVGCGGGVLSEAMAQKGAHVCGIDLSEQVLGAAQLHAWDMGLTTQLKYRHMSVEQLAEEQTKSHPEGYFDVVTCMEMLEHVPDPAGIILSCSRLLKPGGYLFLSTLNKNLWSFLGGVVAAEYLLRLVPKGTHTWSQFIQPSTLAKYCREAHLNVIEMQGMSYNPFKKLYFQTKNININYMLLAQKTSF